MYVNSSKKEYPFRIKHYKKILVFVLNIIPNDTFLEKLKLLIIYIVS